ncbi:MAG: right-handed parallel beta-helix repeat-containing protein [Candidatus Aenigmarchaeota archaeon]|nr:right-handed parallel beta-helix repeat-containing protein [Candidatus Aenigmarchaeota archaeon]
MRFFLVLGLALVFLGVVISQYVQDETDGFNETLGLNQSNEENQSINQNYINLTLREYYFINQTFDFNFSSNYSIQFSILNYSMNYIAENITNSFVLDLLPGYYYLEVYIPELNYTNYTNFNVLLPEIEVYPKQIYVNENVSILIKDFVGKNYSIIIEPDGRIFNFLKVNESEIFHFSFENEGNYTIYINGIGYNLSVLKENEEKILNLSFEEKHFFVGKNISFTINGSAYTDFNFSVFYEDVVFIQIMGSTDQEGFYNGFLYFELPGNYTAVFEYQNFKEEYYIKVDNIDEFQIYNLMENYEKNVSFLITGPALANFYLYFEKENYTKFYYLKTDSFGNFYFEDVFEEGEYNIKLVYEDEIVLSSNFFVKDENTGKYKIIGNDIFYELNEDVFSDDVGIYIKGKNITLDCKGHSVKGVDYAIFVDNSENIELRNCVIENSDTGLIINRSEFVSIFGFVSNKNSNGVIAKYSKNIKVVDSDLSENEFYGLLFFSTENTDVLNSKVKTNINFEIIEKIKN